VGAEDTSSAVREATREEFKVLDPVNVLPRAGTGPVRRALDPRVTYPHGLGVPDAAEERIARMLPDYDLVWFFKLRVANFFKRWRWPGSVADIDDLPSTYEIAEQSNSTGIKSWKAGFRGWVWRRRERLLSERFNVLCVCSEEDRRTLALDSVHVIPNGFPRPSRPIVRHPAAPPRLGFIGLFEHLPNSDGVQWFVRECWYRIRAALPDCRLRLVGKGSEGPLAPAGDGIDRLGWLADSEAEIATWSAMIVPIRLGAGTRVKIADAFSRQCPVVSTRLGAHGYNLESGRELLMADDPGQFANACIDLVKNPARAAAMAARAHEVFLQNWTWEAITPRVHVAIESCLKSAPRPVCC
jgi:glycosyltransferase involved in cell wall biosynthesis